MNYKKSKFGLISISILILAVSCTTDTQTDETKDYPEELNSTFLHHGGIEQWNKFSLLEFSIPRDNAKETTVVDLNNRYTLTDLPHHKIGYDGDNVWIQQKDTTQYQGNPEFYHNLMFYFFAMPFVLGDQGIQYSTAEPVNYNDKTFPGIQISFASNVGASPEDQYILYYDQDTYQMEWLAYTATFFSGEKSDKFNIIKYEDWETVDKLLLPVKIQWYEFNDGIIGNAKKAVSFTNISVSETSKPKDYFQAPQNAKILNKK